MDMKIYKFLTELLVSTSMVNTSINKLSVASHNCLNDGTCRVKYVTVPCFISENSPHHSFLNMSRGPYEGIYMCGSIHRIQKVSKFALTCGLHCWKGLEAHVFIKLWSSPD